MLFKKIVRSETNQKNKKNDSSLKLIEENVTEVEKTVDNMKVFFEELKSSIKEVIGNSIKQEFILTVNN